MPRAGKPCRQVQFCKTASNADDKKLILYTMKKVSLTITPIAASFLLGFAFKTILSNKKIQQ